MLSKSPDLSICKKVEIKPIPSMSTMGNFEMESGYPKHTFSSMAVDFIPFNFYAALIAHIQKLLLWLNDKIKAFASYMAISLRVRKESFHFENDIGKIQMGWSTGDKSDFSKRNHSKNIQFWASKLLTLIGCIFVISGTPSGFYVAFLSLCHCKARDISELVHAKQEKPITIPESTERIGVKEGWLIRKNSHPPAF